MGGWVGWLETDNRAISVQLDLIGTLTGTELGKIPKINLQGMIMADCLNDRGTTSAKKRKHISIQNL